MAVSAGYAAGSSERSTGGVYRQKKASTLHREKELRSVIYNGSDSSEEEEEAMMSPMSLPDSSGQDRWHLGIEPRIEHRQSLPFEVCRREDSNNLRSPLSTVSLQSSPLFTNSKLHQHFAATKLAKKTSAPNYMDIPWYHPKMSRHVAESMLLSKSTPEGTYLLRDSCSTENSLTLSVRSRDSIKHYRISWDGKHLSFGLGKFKNIPEFLEHFESQPIISGESGFLVYLSHPYPRCVKEFTDYEEPVIVEGPDGSTGSNGAPPTGTSRSGYLTKLGHHRKNWKLRWFRLFKSKLCYYTTKDSLVPLREISMSDATSVQRDTSTGKDFCFKLETSYRTFYMYAQTEVEADEWVKLLRAKLDEKSKK